MTKLTLSLLKIPIGILTAQQVNILQTRRSLCLLLLATAVIGVAYRPPRDPPPRRQTSFTGTSELLSGVPVINHEVSQLIA
jgi:hypothetical protein